MHNLKILRASGKDIQKVVNDLGKLRLSVFRDYPYLYDGSMKFEMRYLELYTKHEDSFLFAVYDGDLMVGATTAIPLKHTAIELTMPFTENGYNLEQIMYFGESVLLKEYRGKGIGHLFFEERESYAKSLGNYKLTTFCSVDRPENHPLKPVNYQSNEVFWAKRGYTKQPNLQCKMQWKDIEEQEDSTKSLTFWTKSWM